MAERAPAERRAADGFTWPYRLLLLAFGCSLVLVPELGLRLVGFGGGPELAVPLVSAAPAESPAAGLFEVNPRLGALFFARPTGEGETMVGGHRRELLRLPKPAGTLRIVFSGASTVEGFPLPRNLTSSRFLQAMLQRLLPESRVEVLNLGMTAVASFPVRKIGEAALAAADPDLMLVYGGHNEFFGASGMASLQSMGRSVRAMEAVYLFRRSALVQAAKTALLPPPASPAATRRHLLEVMAAADAVEPEGDLHRAARRSLETNFRRLARRARRRGVPVVLGTLVSNERDLLPLASWEGTAGGRPGDWSSRLAAAAALPAAAARVEEHLRLAAEAPLHAGAAFGLARALEEAGDPAGAAEAYRRARDLDALPWRASRDKNDALRRMAAEEELTLADCERTFAEAAGGATGWALFYDHVHPSLEGQALLARCFLEAIVEARLLPIEPAGLAGLPGWRELARELGANPLEHYLVVHKMATLFAVPPAAASNRAAAERFSRVLRRLERRAAPIELQAIRRWEEGSREAGFALAISYFGAAAAVRAGDPAMAALYLPGALGNAYPFADDRAAAELLAQAACRMGGGLDCDQRLRDALREAEAVAGLPGQPSALLARSLAGLHALAGEQEPARRWDRAAADLAPEAPPWMRAYLRELPDLTGLTPGPGAVSPR